MLAKKFRLPGYLYPTLLKAKLALRLPLITVKVQTNDLDYCRIGAIVSTKISSRAVVRNRLKRRLYAAVQDYFPASKPGRDFLLLPKPALISHSFKQIQMIIKTVLTDEKDAA